MLDVAVCIDVKRNKKAWRNYGSLKAQSFGQPKIDMIEVRYQSLRSDIEGARDLRSSQLGDQIVAQIPKLQTPIG